MNFNSYIFILFFLPVTLAGYFLINRIKTSLGLVFLLGMSLWFYGYFNPKYLFIIIASVLINFGIAKLFGRLRSGAAAKILLIFGILINVGIIFYFKYYDFFIENMNAAFGLDWACKNLVLPLGISFFTFQQISFVVDSYRGETGKYTFLEYAVFVTFFPQLVAGPIVLHSELIPQLQDESKKKFDFDNMSAGIMKFTLGLSKKILLADVFGRAADYAFADYTAVTSGDLILAILCYTFQIYFDFSGYSDMAVGLAQMFNITLPNNFDSPYKADNVADFWKGWHLTLTRFLRTYIYFPLGGSRKGKVRKYLNLFIVFLVSGIWHGANWTFIIWGIMHGIARILYEIFKEPYERLNKVFRWMLNFLFVNLTWLMFRVTYWKDFFSIIKKILRVEDLDISAGMSDTFVGAVTGALSGIPAGEFVMSKVPLLLIIIYVIVALFICLNCENNYNRQYKLSVKSCLITVVLLVGCVISMSNVSSFLYFNF